MASRGKADGGLVLVVDDDAIYRAAAQKLLEQAGYTVEVACDGAEAVRRARSLMPDVILLDLTMPGMDGWEALRELRTGPVTEKRPHVIVLSGHSDAASRELAFARGCDQYIVKTVPGEDIRGAVAAVFWKRNALR
jgi:two-component system, cell cycle response regulator DivK